MTDTYHTVYAEALAEEEAGHYTQAAKLYERADDLKAIETDEIKSLDWDYHRQSRYANITHRLVLAYRELNEDFHDESAWPELAKLLDAAGDAIDALNDYDDGGPDADERHCDWCDSSGHWATDCDVRPV